MSSSEYVALHEFRLDLADGTKEFAPGRAYNGPDEEVKRLLTGTRRLGPLIAKRDSDEGKAAIARARDEKADDTNAAADTASGTATSTRTGKES